MLAQCRMLYLLYRLSCRPSSRWLLLGLLLSVNRWPSTLYIDHCTRLYPLKCMSLPTWSFFHSSSYLSSSQLYSSLYNSGFLPLVVFSSVHPSSFQCGPTSTSYQFSSSVCNCFSMAWAWVPFLFSCLFALDPAISIVNIVSITSSLPRLTDFRLCLRGHLPHVPLFSSSDECRVIILSGSPWLWTSSVVEGDSLAPLI